MSVLLATVLSCSMCEPGESFDPASDQDADQAALVGRDDTTAWYEYGDEKLTGEHLTPEGQLIPWRRPAHMGSLITIRPHFMRELIRIAKDLT